MVISDISEIEPLKLYSWDELQKIQEIELFLKSLKRKKRKRDNPNYNKFQRFIYVDGKVLGISVLNIFGDYRVNLVDLLNIFYDKSVINPNLETLVSLFSYVIKQRDESLVVYGDYTKAMVRYLGYISVGELDKNIVDLIQIDRLKHQLLSRINGQNYSIYRKLLDVFDWEIYLNTYKKEADLRKILEEYIKIRNGLVERNIKLCRLIAFSNLMKLGNGLNIKQDYRDATHQGVLGLIRAIQLFDIRTGNKFSTYARTWILNKVMKYDIPSYIISRAPQELEILRVEEVIYGDKENGVLLYNNISDRHNLEEDIIDKIERLEFWNDLKRYLNPRDYEIVIRRYVNQDSLKEISKRFNLSRERIRQILVEVRNEIPDSFKKKYKHLIL